LNYAPDTYIGRAKAYGADPYSLFHAFSTDPSTDTFYTIQILNATNNLSLLDQPTPRVSKIMINLLVLSICSAVGVTILMCSFTAVYKKLKKDTKIKTTPAPAQDKLIPQDEHQGKP
jgi:hypothetical protein